MEVNNCEGNTYVCKYILFWKLVTEVVGNLISLLYSTMDEVEWKFLLKTKRLHPFMSVIYIHFRYISVWNILRIHDRKSFLLRDPWMFISVRVLRLYAPLGRLFLTILVASTPTGVIVLPQAKERWSVKDIKFGTKGDGIVSVTIVCDQLMLAKWLMQTMIVKKPRKAIVQLAL